MSRPKRNRAEFVKQYIKPANQRIAEPKIENVPRVAVKIPTTPTKPTRPTVAKMPRVTVEEVKHLTGAEINRMSAKELRNVINTAGQSLNKRLQRIEKNDLSVYSPGYKRVARATAGKARFTSKGKNISELRHEVAEMKHFANLRTGSVKGSKVEKQRTNKALKTSVGLSGEEARQAVSQYWENFHRARELHPEMSSGQIFYIYDTVTDSGGGLSDVMNRLDEESEKYFEAVAEEAKHAESENGFFGDPFDLFS